MRKVIPFNRGWLFAPRELTVHASDSDFTPVNLPHSNVILPHHNFDNQEYQFVSTYRKHFTLPEPLDGRRLYVDFDGAMIASTVIINGHTLGDHDGGYTPFSFDLTDYLKDGENVLQVRLDSTERTDIPPYGYIVDYLTFGGIYRDVWLRYVPEVHIADVFVRTKDVLTDKPKVEVDLLINNQSAREHTVTFYPNREWLGAPGMVKDKVDPIADHIVNVPGQSQATTTISFDLTDVPIKLWSLDHPTCFDFWMSVDVDEEQFYVGNIRFGFREAEFREDGFYLNGEKIKLIGLNRHQTFPFIGGAAPARLQRKDADILKYELGVNIVRTSHYPQSPHFLERCDEIGLLVFEEIPGWQYIGDNDWKGVESGKRAEDDRA